MISSRELDGLRGEGDALADHTIKELVATGQLGNINVVLRELEFDGQVPEQVPACVRDYLQESRVVPGLLDPVRVARVQEFFIDDGIQLTACLGIGSMVEAYASRSAARVLKSTSRLDHPEARMKETFQFILYQMAPDPFGLANRFIPAIQKVRLIHAAVRHVLSSSGTWDERDGVPVNQEDMLGTAIMFSVGTLRIMRRLHVHITAQEAEDYYHVWRVTGPMLGVRADLMPGTYREASELYDLLIARGCGPTPEGIALTRSLIARYEHGAPERYRGLISGVIRLMVEPRIADWMKVPRTRWSVILRPMLRVIELLEWAEDRSPAATRILDRAGQRLLSAQIRQLNIGGTKHFDIPESLTRSRKPHSVR